MYSRALYYVQFYETLDTMMSQDCEIFEQSGAPYVCKQPGCYGTSKNGFGDGAIGY